MTRIYTIGGYGHTKSSFVGALLANGIDLFVDVRQRRGMRGSSYSFLNAKSLETMLADVGVSYLHLRDLAPSQQVRALQKAADQDSVVSKRARSKLSGRFVEGYRKETLSQKRPEEILNQMTGYSNVCFFCVEGSHEACHRSLVTEWLEPITGVAKHI